MTLISIPISYGLSKLSKYVMSKSIFRTLLEREGKKEGEQREKEGEQRERESSSGSMAGT